MHNRIAQSPLGLLEDPTARRTIPRVPVEVRDAFGLKALVVLHHDRWRGLVPRWFQSAFAWFEDGALKSTGLTTTMEFKQTLESDSRGRVLLIAEKGDTLLAVEPSGAAISLGVLPPNHTSDTACWIDDEGVALLLGNDICLYAFRAGRLVPRLRFTACEEVWSLRELPHSNRDFIVLAIAADTRLLVVAIGPDDRVHLLGDFGDLDFADVGLFLEDQGKCGWLLDGPMISTSGSITRVTGIDEALTRLDELPLLPLTDALAPTLLPGTDRAPPEGILLEPLGLHGSGPDNAANEVPIARMLPLTAAMVRMLHSAPRRATPDPTFLRMIRSPMPRDIRAYVHAWAMYELSDPTTAFDFWMSPPHMETSEYILEHTEGDSIRVGCLSSGEAVVSDLMTGEIWLFDPGGAAGRYYAFEAFLLEQQQRAEQAGRRFELNDWLG